MKRENKYLKFSRIFAATKIHFLRYFINLAYKGTNFHGWQLQPRDISVQQVLQEALQILLKQPISLLGAGRTDAGVHASQFFAHFDFENILNTGELTNKLNSFLSDSIVIYKIYQVKEDAHARYDALSRTYQYHIFLGRNPFLIETTWQIHQQQLNIEKMNEAAKYLLEYSDFKCFSKSRTDVKTYDCKITEAYWQLNGQELIFTISANRFLRNMVRAIVGTLINIGLGKREVVYIKTLIESRDRRKAGFSACAKGLFLTKIAYPKTLFLEF